MYKFPLCSFWLSILCFIKQRGFDVFMEAEMQCSFLIIIIIFIRSTIHIYKISISFASFLDIFFLCVGVVIWDLEWIFPLLARKKRTHKVVEYLAPSKNIPTWKMVEWCQLPACLQKEFGGKQEEDGETNIIYVERGKKASNPSTASY